MFALEVFVRVSLGFGAIIGIFQSAIYAFVLFQEASAHAVTAETVGSLTVAEILELARAHEQDG